MVVFAPGGSLDGLDPKRDCLANVDAFGRAVPSSRFMAGREFETIAGGEAEPTSGAIMRAVDERTMALPTFARGTGPFGASDGRWMRKGMALADPSMLATPTRAAAASLYAALVTETCLELAGARGPIIVEGPFARNALFLAALAQRVPRPVIARPDATGTTEGAALLAEGANAKPEHRADPPPIPPLNVDLTAYAEEWQRQTVHP
jgi:sugar (pentulose or hexulose) kinase